MRVINYVCTSELKLSKSNCFKIKLKTDIHNFVFKYIYIRKVYAIISTQKTYNFRSESFSKNGKVLIMHTLTSRNSYHSKDTFEHLLKSFTS